MDPIRALKRFDTPTIANAIESLGIRGNLEGYMSSEVRCLLPCRGVMVGYAFTSEHDLTSEHGMDVVRRDLARYYEEMDRFGKRPIVAVVRDSSAERLRAAIWGGQMSALAKRLGAIGLVTDGLVRDLRDARRLGFRYFASGSIASHGYANRVIGINGPIEVGGITVNPGDIVHADENGIVVFPPEYMMDVIERAKEVVKGEERLFRLARSKRFSIERLKELWSV